MSKPSKKNTAATEGCARPPGCAGLSEVWWCAIDPSGLPIWPYLQMRRKDVVECLERDEPDWLGGGLRVAKLQVTECVRHKHNSTAEVQP